MNKLKIIAPTWNDKFELPDGSYSVSVIQDYIEYIIRKHETLTIIPPIHAYINIINYWLVFKIKDGYRLELQTPEKTWNYLTAQKNWKTKTRYSIEPRTRWYIKDMDLYHLLEIHLTNTMKPPNRGHPK